jgi:hypothetical protein
MWLKHFITDACLGSYFAYMLSLCHTFFHLESKHITGHELCSAWRSFPQISMCNVKMYDSCKGVHQQFACTNSHTYRGQKDGCKTREILKLFICFRQYRQLVKHSGFSKRHKSNDFYYTSSAAVLYFRDNSGFVFVQHATVFYYSEMFLVIVSISKLIHTASYGIYLFGLLIN